MANGFLDAVDIPPGSAHQISRGKENHASSISSFSSSSIRKPLPLSLFGEQDDDDDGNEALSIDPVGREEEEEEDEFGEFESVSTQIADANGNGKFSVEENGNGHIHDAGLGNFEEQHSPASDSLSNGAGSWAFPTPTSELMLALHGIRSDRSNGIRSDPTAWNSQRSNHERRFGVQKVAEEKSPIDDDWGEFAAPPVVRSGATGAGSNRIDLIDLISMSDDAPVRPVEDKEGPLPDPPAGNASFSLMDSVVDKELEPVNFSYDDPKPNGVDPGWAFDASARDEKQGAMTTDLFRNAPVSLLDSQQEVPVEALPSDLLWDSSKAIEQEVPVSLLDLEQDVPEAKASDVVGLSDEAIMEGEEVTGLADDLTSWVFDASQTKREISSFSRSVSLPPAKANDGFLADALFSDPVSGLGSHRRSRSSGGFHPSFTPIDEWSPFEELATPNGLVSTSDFPSEATARQHENDSFASLWDTSPQDAAAKEQQAATTNNDLVDLLSLNWDEKAVRAANETSIDKANATVTATVPEETRLKYLESWTQLARVCATELEVGVDIWHETVSHGCSTELFSTEQGGNYFTALTHIYRVCLLLGTTLKVHASWLLPGSCEELLLALDESRLAWSELESALDSTPNMECLRRLEGSLRSLGDLQASTSSLCCALSLLPFDSVPDVPLVVWDDNTYFLPIANLWVNRVSRSSPFA